MVNTLSRTLERFPVSHRCILIRSYLTFDTECICDLKHVRNACYIYELLLLSGTCFELSDFLLFPVVHYNVCSIFLADDQMQFFHIYLRGMFLLRF